VIDFIPQADRPIHLLGVWIRSNPILADDVAPGLLPAPRRLADARPALPVKSAVPNPGCPARETRRPRVGCPVDERAAANDRGVENPSWEARGWCFMTPRIARSNSQHLRKKAYARLCCLLDGLPAAGLSLVTATRSTTQASCAALTVPAPSDAKSVAPWLPRSRLTSPVPTDASRRGASSSATASSSGGLDPPGLALRLVKGGGGSSVNLLPRAPLSSRAWIGACLHSDARGRPELFSDPAAPPPPRGPGPAAWSPSPCGRLALVPRPPLPRRGSRAPHLTTKQVALTKPGRRLHGRPAQQSSDGICLVPQHHAFLGLPRPL
jgi:hypothetical protein